MIQKLFLKIDAFKALINCLLNFCNHWEKGFFRLQYIKIFEPVQESSGNIVLKQAKE